MKPMNIILSNIEPLQPKFLLFIIISEIEQYTRTFYLLYVFSVCNIRHFDQVMQVLKVHFIWP